MPAGEGGLLHETASALLAVWKRSAGSGRLALPLLRTADLLYTEGGLEDLLPDSAFPGGHCLQAALQACHEGFSSTAACIHCVTRPSQAQQDEASVLLARHKWCWQASCWSWCGATHAAAETWLC